MAARPKLVLASSSPRRLALLDQIGVEPDALLPASIDEAPRRNERPRSLAQRLARQKAETARALIEGDETLGDSLVLAADTVVALGRRVLPKADTRDQANDCLRLLSGRAHRVYTSVCLLRPGAPAQTRIAEARVRFKRLSEAEIRAYLTSGEWEGKAGGYAVQGIAGAFVAKMTGSYSTIVGLPLFETAALLGGANYTLPPLWAARA